MPTSIDEYRMIIKVSYCSFNTHRCLISIYSFRLAEKQLLVWSEAPIIIKTKTALCNGSMKNPYYCHHYKASYIHKYVPLKSLRQGWCRPLSLCVCTFIYISVLLCLEIYTSKNEGGSERSCTNLSTRHENICRILFLSLGVKLLGTSQKVRVYPSRVFIIHHLFISWIFH